MKDKLTSRERVLAAMRREPVDYVPCVGSFNPLTPAQRRGYTWNFPWSPDANLEEQLICQVEELGLDEVVSMSVASTKVSDDVQVRTWIEKDVLHKSYKTPAGELHAAVRYDSRWPHGEDILFFSDFNIGHFVEPWIKTENDLDCLKHLQILRDADAVIAESRVQLAEQRRLARRFGLATIAPVGLGLTGAQHLFGATELCMMTVEAPELVDAYLEHEHRINLHTIRILGELGVDIVRRNGFYETADFYSPAMLARFLSKRLNAEVEAARKAGMLACYTVNTGIMPILDHLDQLGFDSLFGIDLAFKDVDAYQLRHRLAPRKAFWIGPSSTHHIRKGPDATRRAVRETFTCFGKVGLILTQCVSSHSIMPWESTAAMIDEWKKLR